MTEKDGSNSQLATKPALSVAVEPKRRRRRRRRRQLFCPAHPDQKVEGNGRKYFLHLLTAEELKRRGMTEKKARLVIQAYPVLVLSNEWLEELFCPACGNNRWYHVIKESCDNYRSSWAPQELWQQVAHVDPLAANPSISEFSQRMAHATRRRNDGKRLFMLK